MQSRCSYPKKQEPKAQNPKWGAVFQENWAKQRCTKSEEQYLGQTSNQADQVTDSKRQARQEYMGWDKATVQKTEVLYLRDPGTVWMKISAVSLENFSIFPIIHPYTVYHSIVWARWAIKRTSSQCEEWANDNLHLQKCSLTKPILSFVMFSLGIFRTLSYILFRKFLQNQFRSQKCYYLVQLSIHLTIIQIKSSPDNTYSPSLQIFKSMCLLQALKENANSVKIF